MTADITNLNCYNKKVDKLFLALKKQNFNPDKYCPGGEFNCYYYPSIFFSKDNSQIEELKKIVKFYNWENIKINWIVEFKENIKKYCLKPEDFDCYYRKIEELRNEAENLAKYINKA